MKFHEVIEQVMALLQREGRMSYRALKREFDLDDEYLEDLKEELIVAKRLAVDGEECWSGRARRQSRHRKIMETGNLSQNNQLPLSALRLKD